MDDLKSDLIDLKNRLTVERAKLDLMYTEKNYLNLERELMGIDNGERQHRIDKLIEHTKASVDMAEMLLSIVNMVEEK